MDYRCIGYLSYRLYKLGWRSGLHKRFPLIKHGLLSIFLYYRRGFTDSIRWEQDLNRID